MTRKRKREIEERLDRIESMLPQENGNQPREFEAEVTEEDRVFIEDRLSDLNPDGERLYEEYLELARSETPAEREASELTDADRLLFKVLFAPEYHYDHRSR